MTKRMASLALCALLLSACSTPAPKIIQATSDAPDLQLTGGLATQVEMPEKMRAVSVAVGNPNLVSAERDGDVVTLVSKGGEGQTNLIIRARDDEGKTKVFQYKILVQDK